MRKNMARGMILTAYGGAVFATRKHNPQSALRAASDSSMVVLLRYRLQPSLSQSGYDSLSLPLAALISAVFA